MELNGSLLYCHPLKTTAVVNSQHKVNHIGGFFNIMSEWKEVVFLKLWRSWTSIFQIKMNNHTKRNAVYQRLWFNSSWLGLYIHTWMLFDLNRVWQKLPPCVWFWPRFLTALLLPLIPSAVFFYIPLGFFILTHRINFKPECHHKFKFAFKQLCLEKGCTVDVAIKAFLYIYGHINSVLWYKSLFNVSMTQ